MEMSELRFSTEQEHAKVRKRKARRVYKLSACSLPLAQKGHPLDK